MGFQTDLYVIDLLDFPYRILVSLYRYDFILHCAIISAVPFYFDSYCAIAVYGSNIGLNEETAAQVPDDEVEWLRKGSIFAFIAWLSYIFMAWSFKGVLMFLYNR